MRFLVNIDVDNLDHGIAFYTRAFDLHPGRRFGADGVELLGGPAPIHLLAKPAGSASTPQVRDRRDYRRHWTPLHLDWVVDDVDAALTRAVQAGARVEQAPATHAWGADRAAGRSLRARLLPAAVPGRRLRRDQHRLTPRRGDYSPMR